MKQGRCFDLLSHIERSDAFGTVELMTTERQEIYAQFSDVQRELPHCLHSVGVEKDFCFLGYAPYFSNRLDGAHFVVCVHHGKQDGVRADDFPHVLRIPVSYTHLRAHETKANLVCRLLLEKKKKNQKKKQHNYHQYQVKQIQHTPQTTTH